MWQWGFRPEARVPSEAVQGLGWHPGRDEAQCLELGCSNLIPEWMHLTPQNCPAKGGLSCSASCAGLHRGELGRGNGWREMGGEDHIAYRDKMAILDVTKWESFVISLWSQCMPQFPLYATLLLSVGEVSVCF